MEFTVSARHMEVTEWMEKHIAEHVDKLPRLDGHITRLTVTLSKDSSGEQVEIIAKCHRSTLVVNAQGHDLYPVIEDAFNKIESRIARLHDKIVSKHAREAQKAAETTRRPE